MAEFDITAEITAVLQQYTGEVMDKVDKAVETCGKGMRKDISATSPKRTKAYSKGWRNKVITAGRGNKTSRAYNETDYQLTHLLEKGHKKRGGKGQAKAYVHIAPAAEKWNEKFIQQCEEACKGQ